MMTATFINDFRKLYVEIEDNYQKIDDEKKEFIEFFVGTGMENS
jgi:hypothetical protein